MKIEIVPEGNKTKKGEGGWDLPFVFDFIFGKIGTLVDGLFEAVIDAIEISVAGAIRRIVAVVIGIIGLCFFLSGVADVLDTLYVVPGIGAVVVGVVVMSVAAIVTLSVRRK